jgi:PTH1 family peptidyl-tRNA hydrolase
MMDAFAKNLGGTWKEKKKYFAEVIETTAHDKKIILAKPQTYMNTSGKAVAILAKTFHVAPEHIWVISDDATIPFGTIRVRTEGTAGGHNGLKSIIQYLGTEGFGRIRLGVGVPPSQFPLEDYVLSHWKKEEESTLTELEDEINNLLDAALERGELAIDTRHHLS